MARTRLRIVTIRYEPLTLEEREMVNSSSLAAAVLTRILGELDREGFAVVHLDAKTRMLSCEITSYGTLTGTLVHPREVFKAAILQNAESIIVGHNHPSGDCSPSDEDHQVRRRLESASEILGIRLLDFLVVTGGGEYWSSADSIDV